jgi:hypothetical protein
VTDESSNASELHNDAPKAAGDVFGWPCLLAGWNDG